MRTKRRIRNWINRISRSLSQNWHIYTCRLCTEAIITENILSENQLHLSIHRSRSNTSKWYILYIYSVHFWRHFRRSEETFQWMNDVTRFRTKGYDYSFTSYTYTFFPFVVVVVLSVVSCEWHKCAMALFYIFFLFIQSFSIFGWYIRFYFHSWLYRMMHVCLSRINFFYFMRTLQMRENWTIQKVWQMTTYVNTQSYFFWYETYTLTRRMKKKWEPRKLESEHRKKINKFKWK